MEDHQMLLQRQRKRDGGGGREDRAAGGEIKDLADNLGKAFTKEANFQLLKKLLESYNFIF